MKNSFFAILASLIATSLFAEPSIPAPVPAAVTDLNSLPILPPSLEPTLQKQGFVYVRFTAGEHDMAQAAVPLPGFGLGYRRLAGDGAADLSFSGLGIAEHKNSRYFWTAPKASYYHYLQPNETRSLYVGGGMAWGGVGKDNKDSQNRQFIGIIPSATLGYEFARKTSFLGFTELTVSQPALAVSRKGAFPSPIAEVSFGIGF